MSRTYQQAGNYIPPTDGGFRDWLNNFADLISNDWSRFALSEADAQMIVTHRDAYEAAYVPCQSAETRTSAKVQHKDAVKASAMASCRVYAQIVKHTKGVSNEDKAALGINIDTTTRTPIPAPTTYPVLTLRAAVNGEHILTYVDQMTPESRAMPHGVTNLDLYVHVGPSATVDPDEASAVGPFSRNPIRHSFDVAQANQVATYFARWRTRRGLSGPWSVPIAMGIAFGGAVQSPSFTPQSPEGPDGGQTKATDGDDAIKIAA